MCLLSRRWETWPCGHHREDTPEIEEICQARRAGDVAGCNRNIRWTDEASPIILPSQERCPECGGECDSNSNVNDAMWFFRDRDARARRVYESRRRQQQSAGGDARYGGGPQVGGRPVRRFQTAGGFHDMLRRSARSPAARSDARAFPDRGPKLPFALQEAARRFRSQGSGPNGPILIDRGLAPGATDNGLPGSLGIGLPAGLPGNWNRSGIENGIRRVHTPMPGVGRGFQLPWVGENPFGGVSGNAHSNPLGGLLGDVHGPGNMRGSTMFPAHQMALPGRETGSSNNPFEGLLRELQASRSSGVGDLGVPPGRDSRSLVDANLGGGPTPFPAHELQDLVILSPTEGIARVPGGLVVFNPSIVGYPPGARDGGGAHQWP